MFFRAAAFRADAFAAHFLGAEAGVVTPPDGGGGGLTPQGLPKGGIGHGRGKGGARRRRRIMLPDGRIITPRSDAEYRAIVSAIISAEPPETIAPPRRRARKRLKGAVVAQKPIQAAPVQALPMAFYDALAETHLGMLYHTQVLRAWEAYLAEIDDEEAIAVLM